MYSYDLLSYMTVSDSIAESVTEGHLNVCMALKIWIPLQKYASQVERGRGCGWADPSSAMSAGAQMACWHRSSQRTTRHQEAHQTSEERLVAVDE